MEGIYNNYKQEYDSLEAKKQGLHKRLDLSIHMMVDLIVEESGNSKESLSHASFLKEFIKGCDLESKLKIVKHLDL